MCIKYFLNEDKWFSVFGLRLSYSLIHKECLGHMREKDNFKGIRKQKKATIWRQHLPMQRNVEVHNWIVVQNINTNKTSSMSKNTKKCKQDAPVTQIFGCGKSCHTYHATENNNQV